MTVVDKSTRDVVEVEVRIAARPQTVFSFLTDPDRMARWMGSSVDLDPRLGGVYRVAAREGVVALGSYVEVVPNSKVVFTWGWEGSASVPPGSTTVEITLAPDANGTLLRLRHTGLPEQERDMHSQGWQHYMARLQVAATGGDPGPDPYERAA